MFFGLEKFQREIDEIYYYCVQLSEKNKIYLINSTLTKPRSSSHIYLTKEKFDYNFKKKNKKKKKICIVDQTNTSANAEQITINKCENKLSKNETIKHDNFCVCAKYPGICQRNDFLVPLLRHKIFWTIKFFRRRVCCVLR